MKRIGLIVFGVGVLVGGLMMASAKAAEQRTLRVDTTERFFSDVRGDGLEQGLEVVVEVSPAKLLGHSAPLSVVIPRADNSAGCRVSQLTPDTQTSTTLPPSSYRVKIRTEVVADSGGCLILIQDGQDGQTRAIVRYSYFTE